MPARLNFSRPSPVRLPLPGEVPPRSRLYYLCLAGLAGLAAGIAMVGALLAIVSALFGGAR